MSRFVDRGCTQQSAWLTDLEVVEHSSEWAGLRRDTWLLGVFAVFSRLA
jgi:hypothetical protein